jgi:hypothetical protein
VHTSTRGVVNWPLSVINRLTILRTRNLQFWWTA